MMTFQAIYSYGVVMVLVTALVMFIALFRITAPYGRHWRQSWGPSLNPRIGWIIMELPSVVLFAGIYLLGNGVGYTINLVLFCLWEIHYVQRTLVYPALMRSGAGKMPVSIVIMGFVFNVVNASLNATALTHLPSGFSGRQVSMWFVAGVVIFLVGFGINVSSDHILRNLRKLGEKRYTIPRGGLFRWITSPNYFGEIVEWCGWALASWTLAGVAFAAFTFANLVPRAWTHHKWYHKNFPDYPKNRKAILPGFF